MILLKDVSLILSYSVLFSLISDILIKNRNNILNTPTYHKSTYSGLLLNFNSFTSRFYKISFIKN